MNNLLTMDRVAVLLGVSVNLAYRMRMRDRDFPETVGTKPLKFLLRQVDQYKNLLNIDLNDYYTIDQIAELMPNTARSTVINFVRRNGISRRLMKGVYYHPKVDVDRLLLLVADVLKMFNDGRYSRTEISEKLNVSISEIRSIIKRSHGRVVEPYRYCFSDGYTKQHIDFDTLSDALMASRNDILTDRAFAVSISCGGDTVRNTKQLFAEVYK